MGNLFYIQKDGEKVTRYDYDELNQLVREDDVEAGWYHLNSRYCDLKMPTFYFYVKEQLKDNFPSTVFLVDKNS